jgi:predicted aminopeptidase
MKIAISADCSTITMRKTVWSMVCPAADLGKWINFYTSLRDRKGGAYAQFYAQDVADLEGAQERLDRRISLKKRVSKNEG